MGPIPANAAGRSLTDKVKQEIHNLLAVHARELCMRQRSGGANQGQKFLHLEKSYHGTESHQSILQLFLDAKPPYDGCFDRLDIVNNREGNELRQDAGVRLELKDLIYCQLGTMLCVHERGFTSIALQDIRGKQVTGQNLNDRALSVLQTYKHALKFHKDYQGSIQDVNPSGLKVEDMLLYVRQKMFVKYKGAKDPAGARSKKEDVSEEDMPDGYLFTGYFTFAVFGPQPLSKTSLSCLTVDGSNVPTCGRAKSRAAEAQANAVDRSVGAGGFVPEEYKGRRGITLEQKASAAAMAQRDAIAKRKNVTELLFVQTAEHKNLVEELENNSRMLEVAKKQVPMNRHKVNYLESEEEELFEALRISRKRKKVLQQHSEKLMNETPKRQVVAYMNQIGDFGDESEVEVVSSPSTSVNTPDRSPSDDDDEEEDEEEEDIPVEQV